MIRIKFTLLSFCDNDKPLELTIPDSWPKPKQKLDLQYSYNPHQEGLKE